MKKERWETMVAINNGHDAIMSGVPGTTPLENYAEKEIISRKTYSWLLKKVLPKLGHD